MKNQRLHPILLLLLLVCGNVALAQDGSGVTAVYPNTDGSFGSLSIERKFQRSAHQLIDPPEMSRRLAKGELPPFKPASAVPVAGEQVVLHVLPSRNKLRPGESTDILLSRVQTTGKVRVGARYFQAGFSGHYDGTIPIVHIGNPDFNFNASIDLSRDQQIYKLLTLNITPWANPGMHQFEVVVWSETGELLQQTFVDLYVFSRGPNDPTFEIRSMNVRANSVLTGKFPVGLPAWYWVGTPHHGFFWNNAQFATVTAEAPGTQLTIPGWMAYQNTTDMSVYLLYPDLRYVLMSRDAVAPKGLHLP